MTTNKLDSLPKWAKDLILNQDNAINSLNEKIRQINGDSTTNTFITNGLEVQPIPEGSVVEFRTGHKNLNKVSVCVRKDGDIEVYADSRVGEQIIIKPISSNVLHINFIKR